MFFLAVKNKSTSINLKAFYPLQKLIKLNILFFTLFEQKIYFIREKWCNKKEAVSHTGIIFCG